MKELSLLWPLVSPTDAAAVVFVSPINKVWPHDFSVRGLMRQMYGGRLGPNTTELPNAQHLSKHGCTHGNDTKPNYKKT